MRSKWTNGTTRENGFIALIIILVLVVGGLLAFLYAMRQSAEGEAMQFARQVIEKCAFQHDVNFLHSVVAADRRLTLPPSMDYDFIDQLTKLGTPDRNYAVTGDLQFDNYFFSPHGTYKSILTFPDRHGTIYVAIARPSGIWLLTDFGIMWERPPQ
jgi:hypothetical protein